MAKIWEFFENMNEIVYASDVDSHEIIYMNKKALEAYNIRALSEVVGRKCYEVLQGASRACVMCNGTKLKEGCFVEWHYFSPVLHKDLEIKDTMIIEDGRKCRVEIALDGGRAEELNSKIANYQNVEFIVNEALRVALKAPTPDHSIWVLLEYLGKMLNGERTYIFERNEFGNDDNTYEWTASGISPEKENLQNVPAQVCASWYQRFAESESIIIKELEEIKETAPQQYEILKRQGINSLVVVPLYDDTKVLGFFGVDNPPVGFLDYVSDMLQIMGHFIVSALKRRDLVRQLLNMSYHDQLTGIGNRYAMHEYAAKQNSKESLGVVYGDITGLKRVNDTKGHEEGDKLLIRASECLKRAFGGYGLFRIGGDEMLALCAGITKEELEEKVKALKKDLKEQGVVMATGIVWQKAGMLNLDCLLSRAEKLMYEEKAAYYRENGIDRRK